MKPLISLGSLIDSSFAHYKNHLPALLGITLWLLVSAVPSALGLLLTRDGMDFDAMTFVSFGLSVLGGLIASLVSLHVTVALILSLREQRQGRAVDPRVFLKKAFSLDLSYLWATILKGFFVILLPLIPFALALPLFLFGLGLENSVMRNLLGVLTFLTLLLALGGAVKFSLSYAFVPYTTILDGAKGIASLRASANLVRGRWWPTFWRVVVPTTLYSLIFIVLLGAVLWVTGIVAISTSQESFLLAKFFTFINFFISTLLNAFFIPLVLLNDYYLYENLRETTA